MRHDRAAIPTQVSDLVGGRPATTPQRRIVFHGHDTWGLGVANTLAAIDAGATLVDGSLGGLGGCPLAPGASGNTSTEDLLFATRPDWFTPSTLASMVEITDKLLAELGEPNRSRSAQGARSKSTAFDWVIGSSGDGCAVVGDSAFLVTYPIPEPGLSSLRAAGRVYYPPPHQRPDEARDACSSDKFDVVVAQLSDRFDADLLAQAKLTGISNYAVGYDSIDVPAATNNGIV